VCGSQTHRSHSISERARVHVSLRAGAHMRLAVPCHNLLQRDFLAGGKITVKSSTCTRGGLYVRGAKQHLVLASRSLLYRRCVQKA